jgi:hypothetical protein
MFNYVLTKIKNQLNLQQDQSVLDQAIARVDNAQHITLLRTDYLE